MSHALGIYIHWPFCAAKCPYCDFNSHVSDQIDHKKWAKAYSQELKYYAKQTEGRPVTSIFFGGGTPSLMRPETTATVIETIKTLWPVESDLEITLEANPTSVEIDKFKSFKAAGINRVSVGVQALRDDVLKFLGRKHSADEALKAVNAAKTVFDRYSFDLMYARPGQTVQDWQEELEGALKHVDGHLSLYQLTIEKGTPFFIQHERGDFRIPDQDQGGALYEVTQDILEKHGLPAYEISNHARPGQESRHNLIYWRYQDYIGVGPGAHGRLTLAGQKYATRAHRAPDVWLDKVNTHGHGAHDPEPINTYDQFAEALMMGLRLREGVDLSRFDNWQNCLDLKQVTLLEKEGYMHFDPDKEFLTATIEGFQRLDGILPLILNGSDQPIPVPISR